MIRFNQGIKTYTYIHIITFLKYINICIKLPVCKNKWFLRLVILLKPLSQIWHRWGQDPLWIYMWDLRSPGVGNDFWQSSHLWGFSWKKNIIFISYRIYEKNLYLENFNNAFLYKINAISEISKILIMDKCFPSFCSWL